MSESEPAENTNIETATVTIELDLDVRLPTEDGSFAFDPLAQELTNGQLRSEFGGAAFTVKKSRVREDTPADIIAEFERPDRIEPVGVFLSANQIAKGAVKAVQESDEVELPGASDDG